MRFNEVIQMKKFLIAGSIVDTDADKETFEDVTPV